MQRRMLQWGSETNTYFLICCGILTTTKKLQFLSLSNIPDSGQLELPLEDLEVPCELEGVVPLRFFRLVFFLFFFLNELSSCVGPVCSSWVWKSGRWESTASRWNFLLCPLTSSHHMTPCCFKDPILLFLALCRGLTLRALSVRSLPLRVESGRLKSSRPKPQSFFFPGLLSAERAWAQRRLSDSLCLWVRLLTKCRTN